MRMIILNKRDSWFWKLAEYALYVFIAVFPFINYRIFLYSGTSIRATELILLATLLGIAFAVWLFKKRNSLSIPKSPIFLAVLAYFIFLIISGIAGVNFHTSFWSLATRMTGIWYFLNLGFVMYIVWGLVSDRIKQNRMILITTLSTALYSLLSLFGPEGLGVFFKGYQMDGFTFGNSTFAGMYLFAVFLLSLYYLFQSEKKKWWMFVIPIVLVANPYLLSSNFLGEARTSSLAVLLSLVGILVVWGVSKIKDKKARSITSYSIFGVSVLIAIIGTFSLLSQDGYLRKVYLSQATAARPLVWEMSGKVIGQRPLFGWGTDNFDRVFEINYDNRLLQDEYGNEAWFDRAHNVFIDQVVENGFVGITLYVVILLVLVASLIYVALNSTEKKDRIFAAVLIVYFPLHFLELQTAFDTTISYFILAVMIAFAAVLFDRTRMQITKAENEWDIGNWVKYIFAGVFFIFFLWSFIWGWIPFVRTQFANGYIRTIGSAEGRISKYPTLLATPVDEHAFLWRTSTDFQRGIAENPKILEDAKKVQFLKQEIAIYENAYKEYVKDNPDHFRAKLNLADVLIYQRLFGVDKLQEAQLVLDEAIKLVPQAPQSYWMKAVAYIYMRKFDLAREYAKKGLELNPKIKTSQDIVQYVEKSIKDFPNIELYFFRQI